jgi:hypothetical protein
MSTPNDRLNLELIHYKCLYLKYLHIPPPPLGATALLGSSPPHCCSTMHLSRKCFTVTPTFCSYNQTWHFGVVGTLGQDGKYHEVLLMCVINQSTVARQPDMGLGLLFPRLRGLAHWWQLGDQPIGRAVLTQSWCDRQNHLAGSQETWVRKYCLNFVYEHARKVFLHAVNLRHGLLPLRRKWCSGFLSPLKIHRSGSNPRTLAPVASTLTTSPPRSTKCVIITLFLYKLPLSINDRNVLSCTCSYITSYMLMDVTIKFPHIFVCWTRIAVLRALRPMPCLWGYWKMGHKYNFLNLILC